MVNIDTLIGTGTYQEILSQHDGSGSAGTMLGFGQSGNLYSNLGGYVTLLGGLTTGTWQHMALVYGNGTLTFYLDGVLQTSVSRSLDGNGDITMGINRSGGGNPFQGSIDEVRLWNVARSQAEIQAYMKSTLSGDESGLAAYYPLDESTGSSAIDAAGTDDGTLNNDPQRVTSDAPLTQLPPPGSALEFDGAGDYVELPFILNPAEKSTFTAEVWFKADNFTAQYQELIKQANGNGTGRTWLALNQSGRVYSMLGNSWSGADFVSAGTWNHAALVYDNGTSKIYVNGSLAASASITPESSDGALQLSYSWYLDGALDEVRIWDTARSEAEIQAYMNRTLDGDESGLLAYYDFDEVAGSNATRLSDIAGSNHGTLYGDATWVDSGVELSKVVAPGNALSFDGSGDYVEIAGYDGITGSNARSVEAWIKTTTTGAIASWGTAATGNKWIFRVQNDNGTAGTIRVEVEGGYIVGSTVVNDGAWHHVAATFEDDDTPDVEDVKLYVDGVLETTGAVSAQSIDTASGTVNIGNDHSSRYFNGEMDEVRIWSAARTQAEIQAGMSKTLNSAETDLAAYYRFDQNSGTELIDQSGNNYDGTLNGGPTWVTSTVPLD